MDLIPFLRLEVLEITLIISLLLEKSLLFFAKNGENL